MNVFAVIHQDRHTDTTVTLFACLDKAIEYARLSAKECSNGGIEEYLTEGMKEAGWKYHVAYSWESDCLWVVETKINV